jgi:hypothetical protein
MQLSALANRSSTVFSRQMIAGKFSSARPAVQLTRVMGNGLDAKHAFAFAVDL